MILKLLRENINDINSLNTRIQVVICHCIDIVTTTKLFIHLFFKNKNKNTRNLRKLNENDVKKNQIFFLLLLCATFHTIIITKKSKVNRIK